MKSAATSSHQSRVRLLHAPCSIPNKLVLSYQPAVEAAVLPPPLPQNAALSPLPFRAKNKRGKPEIEREMARRRRAPSNQSHLPSHDKGAKVAIRRQKQLSSLNGPRRVLVASAKIHDAEILQRNPKNISVQQWFR